MRRPHLTTRFVGLLVGWALAAGLLGAPQLRAEETGLNLDKVFSEVKGWKIGFSGTVGGCVAAATFDDETTVWLGFKGKSGAYIAFSNPKWKSIEPKGGYTLRLQTSRRNWRGKFFGFERESEKGVYAGDLKTAFLGEVAGSSGIRVYLEGQVVTQVSLSGSHDALISIIACQKEFLEAAARSGDDPDGTARKHGTGGSSGTGFFVSQAGHVLTNNHVIDGCSTIRVVSGGDTTPAALVAKDKANDLAILRTSVVPTAVPAFRATARLGESVSVFGFPLPDLLSSSGNFTAGSITAVTGLGDDSRMVQISAPVQPGNSGGPLIDKYGNIVGVIVAKLDVLHVASAIQDVPQNVNFAIKSSIATNFMLSNGLTPVDAAKSRELPPEATAELAQTFTVRVLCH